jgi:hypothetical protein
MEMEISVQSAVSPVGLAEDRPVLCVTFERTNSD